MAIWIPKDGDKCTIVDIFPPDVFVPTKNNYIGKSCICGGSEASVHRDDCVRGYFLDKLFICIQVKPIENKILIFKGK